MNTYFLLFQDTVNSIAAFRTRVHVYLCEMGPRCKFETINETKNRFKAMLTLLYRHLYFMQNIKMIHVQIKPVQ